METRDPAYESGAEGRTRLATALGWVSNGLAAAQLPAPRRFARAIGVDDGRLTPWVVRAVGLREAAAGGGILSSDRPAGWLWARVAGDAMDLALLGAAMARAPRSRRRLAVATAAVAGVTVLDALAAKTEAQRRGPTVARRAVTVNKPVQEVYAFWRAFENLPQFMAHVESVETMADGRSHWRVRGPAGRSVEWDAATVEDITGERISWRSLPGADVGNAGTVEFRPAPGDRGTEVHVELRYDPPAGAFGTTVAKLLGEEPEALLADDLFRFKQLLETGEVTRSEGTPSGPNLAEHLRQRAAQPLEQDERDAVRA